MKKKIDSSVRIKKMIIFYTITFFLLIVLQRIAESIVSKDFHIEALDGVIDTLSLSTDNISFIFLILEIIFILSILVLGRSLIKEVRDTNQRLLELAENAKAANYAKSIFLANMSHEIRTPLNAIIGFSDILTVSELPAKEKEYSEIVARSAKSLLAIINDILDISKIESDVFDINNESFEIEANLEQITELYSVKADEKKIQLSYFYDQSIPSYLIGDSFRIQQVISNLLSNAIKFTPQKGNVSFKTLLLGSTENKVTIRFAVKDTGIGISKAGQEKIFEPFTQADGSITRKFGGTGLGLSISRKIVSAMNSTLTINSEEHKGSLFSFDVEFDVDKSRTRNKIEKRNVVFGIYPEQVKDKLMRDRLVDVLANFGEVLTNVGDVYHKEVNFLFGIEAENIQAESNSVKTMYPNIPIIYVSQDMNLSSEESKEYYQLLREPFYKSKFEKLLNRLMKSGTVNDVKVEDTIYFKGTVLVAEDNSTNQILMQVLLEKLGVTIIFADNGMEASQKYKENSVDIILMDIHMPVLDGISALKDIRQLEQNMQKKKVPIIALTADAIKGDREHYLEIGMDDYLAKPIELNRLIAVFTKYLERTSKMQKGRVIGQVKDINADETGIIYLENPKESLLLEEKEIQKTDINNSIFIESSNGSNNSTVKDLSFKERVMLESSGRLTGKELKENWITSEKVNRTLTLKPIPYNREAAMRGIGVDDLTLDMLLDNFLLTYRKDLEKLREFIDKKDLQGIASQAHYIKGSAVNLRINPLSNIMKEIEVLAKTNQEIVVDFDSIHSYIEKVLK